LPVVVASCYAPSRCAISAADYGVTDNGVTDNGVTDNGVTDNGVEFVVNPMISNALAVAP